MQPNAKFVERMQLKQQASADRAIAREQRVQEEERRLLEIAKGERQVSERQAKAKVKQIEKTTNAETDKQLAIAQCDAAAWPVILAWLRRDAVLVLHEGLPRYVLGDKKGVFGPSLSAAYVKKLAKAGVLRPTGALRFRLNRQSPGE